MPTQVSPGVLDNEIDLTTIVPSVDTTEAAIAGVYGWGAVNEPRLITSEDELVQYYGPPSDSNFETWFTGSNFLSYSNKLYVSRAVDANTKNAVAGPSYNANTVSTTLVKNRDDYLHQHDTVSANGASYYVAKYPGKRGESLRIAVCDSASQYTSTLTSTDQSTSIALSFTVGSNVATLTVTNSANNLIVANTVANTVLAAISVNDILKAGNTTIGSQFVKVSGKSVTAAGTGNNALNSVVATINLATIFTLSSNVTVTDAISRYWEFYSSVDRAPGTSPYTAVRGGLGDELHVVVVDEGGLFTGTKGEILEVYPHVSRAVDAVGEQGGSLFVETVINQSSPYVWYTYDRAGSTRTTAKSSVPVTTPQPLSLNFFGGSDSLDESTIDVGDLAFAYDVYKSSEDIDISLVLAGKARGGVNDTQMGNYIIDNITETRKDCLVFISPRREAVVQNFYAIEEDVVAFRNGLRSTSYGVLDSGYKYQYDKYNDKYRYVPLNGDIAGLCARTDSIRNPWWSPAGFNRGNIKNVVKLSFNPNKARRDILYPNGVNPVVTFPGDGTVLYGDKTLLAQSSAFDRINVRRLFIVLRKAISKAAKYTLFEFNDSFTRANFVNMVEPYLRDVQGQRGIYAFKVVCDETNNTPQVIDSNQFVGDIYVKPARSINYITLSFVAVRTGVEFAEVVGKF